MRRFVSLLAGLALTAWPAAGQFTTGMAASGVFGQPSFDVAHPPPITSIEPLEVEIDEPRSVAYVLDYRHSRVLRYALRDGAMASTADVVFLQRDDASREYLGPMRIAVDEAGTLYVSQQMFRRVLRFRNAHTAATGTEPDGVFGFQDLQNTRVTDPMGRFCEPTVMAADAAGTLFVADVCTASASNQRTTRVLRFRSARTLPSGSSADIALSAQPNPTSPYFITDLVAAPGDRLYVADGAYAAEGTRTVRFDAASTRTSVGPPDAVLWRASQIAIDAEGRYYTSTERTLHRYDQPLTATFNTPPSATFRFGNPPHYGSTSSPPFMGAMALGTSGRLFLTETWMSVGTGSRSGGYVAWIDRPDAATSGAVVPLAGVVETGPPAGLTRLTPRGIAVDPTSGKVFVSDVAHARVLRFASVASLARGEAPEGVFGQPDFQQGVMSASPSGMYAPHGLTVDGNGHLYVADWGGSRVRRFDAAATRANGAPADALFGSTTLNAVRGWWEGLNWLPTMDIAVGPTGALFMQTEYGVRRYDHAATVTGALDPPVLLVSPDTAPGGVDFTRYARFPRSLTVDPEGRLYVTEGGYTRGDATRLLRFDGVGSGTDSPPASGIHTIAGGLSSADAALSAAAGVAHDGASRIYMADRGTHRIVGLDVRVGGALLDSNALIAVVIGQPDPTSSGPGTSASRLNSPSHLAVANGGRTLLVADAGNHRVLVFGDLTVDAERPAAPASGVEVSVRGARVHVALPAAEAVRVEVFDVLGRRVAILHDGPADALALDLPSSLASGVYVVRARTAASHATAMVVVR